MFVQKISALLCEIYATRNLVTKLYYLSFLFPILITEGNKIELTIFSLKIHSHPITKKFV